MIKKKIRLYISVLLVFSLLGISLCGCSKKSGSTDTSASGDVSTRKSEEKKYPYNCTSRVVPGLSGKVTGSVCYDGKIYVSLASASSADKESSLYVLSTATDSFSPADISMPDCSDILAFDAVEDSITVLYRTTSGSIILQKNNSSADVTALVSTDTDALRLSAGKEVTGILSDGKILIFDPDLQEKGVLQGDGTFIYRSIARTNTGLLAYCTEKSGGAAAAGKSIGLIQSSDLSCTELSDASPGTFSDNCMILNGTPDSSLYYRGDDGIYSFNTDTQHAEKLLGYADSILNPEDTISFLPVSDSCFLNVHNTEGNEVVTDTYLKTDHLDLSGKTVLTYGCYVLTAPESTSINQFNRSHPDIYIQPVEYREYDDPGTELNLEAADGKLPDILNFSMLPYGAFDEKDVLADLTPFLSRDPDISEEDFSENYLKSIKRDGKIHALSSGFRIDTVMTKAEYLQNPDDGWTVQDFISVWDAHPKANVSILNTTKEDLLGFLLDHALGDYVNYEAGECFFDSDDFRNTLKCCNRLKLQSSDEVSDSDLMNRMDTEYSSFRKGDFLLMEMQDIGPEQLLENMKYPGTAFPGYPCKDRDGSCMKFYDMLSISALSHQKEIAWEFLKTYLTKSYQEKYLITCDDAFPTRKDVMDELCVKLKTPPDSGNTTGKTTYTDAEIAEMRQFADGITRYSSWDTSLEDIVTEEAGSYFSGDHTLDDTVKIIQDRVSTYLSEQKS